MIGYIQGKLIYADPAIAVVDVQGIGYEIKIPLTTFSKIKELQQVKLFTHLYVREDAQLLYGFSTPDEKQLFLQLISVSGVGPNTAIMILSSLSAEELEDAILKGNVGQIQSVKGIGGKTAQRLILELRDKIAKSSDAKKLEEFSLTTNNTQREEALSALVTLGFNKNQAEKNINLVIKKHGPDLSLEELVKLALKSA